MHDHTAIPPHSAAGLPCPHPNNHTHPPVACMWARPCSSCCRRALKTGSGNGRVAQDRRWPRSVRAICCTRLMHGPCRQAWQEAWWSSRAAGGCGDRGGRWRSSRTKRGVQNCATQTHASQSTLDCKQQAGSMLHDVCMHGCCCPNCCWGLGRIVAGQGAVQGRVTRRLTHLHAHTDQPHNAWVLQLLQCCNLPLHLGADAILLCAVHLLDGYTLGGPPLRRCREHLDQTADQLAEMLIARALVSTLPPLRKHPAPVAPAAGR
jgi:hypothetical protein